MEENTSCFHEALYAAGTKYITHIPDKPNSRSVAAEGILRWGAKLLIKIQSYKSAKKEMCFSR